MVRSRMNSVHETIIQVANLRAVQQFARQTRFLSSKLNGIKGRSFQLIAFRWRIAFSQAGSVDNSKQIFQIAGGLHRASSTSMLNELDLFKLKQLNSGEIGVYTVKPYSQESFRIDRFAIKRILAVPAKRCTSIAKERDFKPIDLRKLISRILSK